MKEANPRISVVMPVYNAGKYLKGSIESTLNQTFDNFEFIIIDDGSSDNSWNIIQDYAKKDSRIIAISQENKGVVETANYAATIARGEYIARTDSDDISFPSKLLDLIKTADKHPDVGVVVGSIEVIDEHDEFIYRELVPVYDSEIKRALYIRNPIPNGATLIKRSLFQSVDGFSDVFAEDCHLWSKLWPVTKFRGTGTTVYKWRVNPSGLTMTNQLKSIRKEREYLSKLWSIQQPIRVKRSQVIKRSNAYLRLPGRFGADYKKVFLYDLCRVAVHQIKHGHFKDGFLQLITVASTGRIGLRTAIGRVYLSTQGAILSRKAAQ